MQPNTEKLYTVSKTRLGDDCGSDHELLIGKFRLKLKKVGKTTRPLRYDLRITINWKILKEMGMPDHLTCLLRNLYAGQEATVTLRWLGKRAVLA